MEHHRFPQETHFVTFADYKLEKCSQSLNDSSCMILSILKFSTSSGGRGTSVIFTRLDGNTNLKEAGLGFHAWNYHVKV